MCALEQNNAGLPFGSLTNVLSVAEKNGSAVCVAELKGSPVRKPAPRRPTIAAPAKTPSAKGELSRCSVDEVSDETLVRSMYVEGVSVTRQPTTSLSEYVDSPVGFHVRVPGCK